MRECATTAANRWNPSTKIGAGRDSNLHPVTEASSALIRQNCRSSAQRRLPKPAHLLRRRANGFFFGFNERHELRRRLVSRELHVDLHLRTRIGVLDCGAMTNAMRANRGTLMRSRTGAPSLA